MKEIYEIAASCLECDLKTGQLNWNDSPLVNPIMRNKKAGSKYQDGYVYVRFQGHRLLAHRLVWLKVHGHFPVGYIDHSNGIKSDNTPSNLRLASVTENNRNRTKQSNNTSGFKGVTFHKATGKYQAKICVHKRRISLGYFQSAELAALAYQSAAKEYHGEFSRL